MCWACLVIIGCAAWPSAAAHAQQGLSAAADVIFYGDNTEFRNAFSEGETIFGTAARGEARIELGNGVRLAAGVFVNQRFGSDSAFDLVRPVLALSVRGRRSTFIFGTLDTPRAATPPGPDRAGPHGLLPPIQRERLAFDRHFDRAVNGEIEMPPVVAPGDRRERLVSSIASAQRHRPHSGSRGRKPAAGSADVRGLMYRACGRVRAVHRC